MHLVFIGTLGLLATASGALAKGRTRGPVLPSTQSNSAFIPFIHTAEGTK